MQTGSMIRKVDGPTRMLLSVGMAALATMGCNEPPERVAPAPRVETPTQMTPAAGDPAAAEAPEPEPDEQPEAPGFTRFGGVSREASACERHADCRVFAGLCGRATACNASSLDAVRRQLESLGRHGSCGRGSLRVRDTTPACVGGSCRAQLGPRAEHQCTEDAECAILEGLCGPTEAVRSDQRDVFQRRIAALTARGVGCGYGPHERAVRAVCADGLCVPRRPR